MRIFRTDKLIFVCVVLVLSLLAAGYNCRGTRSPYPIKSSGLIYGGGNLGAATPIYWLDNDRVLFPGYEVIHKTEADGQDHIASSSPGIYIWDTEGGTYSRHADLEAPRWSLCFNHGFIAYSTPDSPQDSPSDPYAYKRKVIRSGMLGQESEQPRVVPAVYPPEQCKGAAPKFGRLLHPDVAVWNLLAGDGYIYVAAGREPGLEILPAVQNQTVKLVRPGLNSPIPLPMMVKEFDVSASLTYSEYAQKYVLVPATWRGHDITKPERWPDEPIPIYLIAADGKVDIISIPNVTFGRPMGAFPTARGLFWTSNNAPSTNSIQAGGWLLQNGKAVKLFDHLVNGAGVSPNGCKIAFANDPHRGNSLVVVQVINLCSNKRVGE